MTDTPSKPSSPLVAGDPAPDFTLDINGGGDLTLSDQQGAPVVVYFYPKDNTAGCTTEAVDFSLLLSEFEKTRTKIVGVSPDSVKKHDNFVTKHDLKLTLASDPDTAVCNAYGVWVEKKMYGKSYMGVERSTFLIDKNGRIAKIWSKVKVKDHAAQVLDAVQAL